MSRKVINYIWLGGNDKSKVIIKCIKSWKRFLPDWEIKEWNESNIDIGVCDFCQEAYVNKMYAFSADVLRFYILKEYGGLYLDTDVEIIKSFEDLTENFDSFAGFEINHVNPGLVLYSKSKDNPIITEMFNKYKTMSFVTENGLNTAKTVCDYFTELLEEHGLIRSGSFQKLDAITIFPKTYFCPTDILWRNVDFTNETRTIHHFDASWKPIAYRRKVKIKRAFYRIFGKNTIDKVKKIVRCKL